MFRVCTVTEGEVNNAVFSAKIYRRLCRFIRQLIQTGAAPASQNHGEHIVVIHSFPPETNFIKSIALVAFSKHPPACFLRDKLYGLS